MSTFSIRVADAVTVLAGANAVAPTPTTATGSTSAETSNTASVPTATGGDEFELAEAKFSSGVRPLAITRGTVRVFRDRPRLELGRAIKEKCATGPSPMLCAVAVPGRLLVTDFCSFISPFHELVAHMRVVRDSKPGRYMVLMLFRTQEDADQCFREHDGRAFNAFETQRCAMAYVARVDIVPPTDESQGSEPSSSLRAVSVSDGVASSPVSAVSTHSRAEDALVGPPEARGTAAAAASAKGPAAAASGEPQLAHWRAPPAAPPTSLAPAPGDASSRSSGGGYPAASPTWEGVAVIAGASFAGDTDTALPASSLSLAFGEPSLLRATKASAALPPPLKPVSTPAPPTHPSAGDSAAGTAVRGSVGGGGAVEALRALGQQQGDGGGLRPFVLQAPGGDADEPSRAGVKGGAEDSLRGSPSGDETADEDGRDALLVTAAATLASSASDSGSVEMPTCPVCLDRLDAPASGLLTTICNHSFHADCLRSWGGLSCPVCRHFLGEDSQEGTLCEVCGIAQGLWMCLVCGHVGCGRYERSHGVEHFRETSHTYAVDLVTQRVWDYAGDGYVHRLLEHGATGKMVEASAVPGASGYDSSGSAGDSTSLARSHVAPDTDATLRAAADEKREALGVEYSLLLTSQLEAQRQWFEARRNEAEETAALRESELLSELEEERAARQKAEARLASRHKESRLSTLATARLHGLEEEVAYLRELNKQLTADQHKWKADVERHQRAARAATDKAEARVAEMEAQARDLMFFLEMQDKLGKELGPGDAEGAAVLVTEEPDVGGRGGSRRRGGRSRRPVKSDKHARFKAKQVLNTAKAAREAAQAEMATPTTREDEQETAAATASSTKPDPAASVAADE